MPNRIEHDGLGDCEVPDAALWGVHTQRALANFRLAGTPVAPELVRAVAVVKKAAAQANAELGYLSPDIAAAIEAACDEIAAGRHADQFPVDALQGGAGTSTNMNVNEVVAHLAAGRLGDVRGDCARVHPLGHVNLHQSTNDVYPTALRIAAIAGLRTLSARCAELQGAFQRKEQEFAGIVCMGRTEWQDAVPLTLGAEYSAFAEAVARDRWRTFKCEERLRVVNLGGTAVGTGLAAPRRYIFLVVEKLRALTGLGLARAENPVDATANADALVEVSGMLKACACNLIKIARDLRVRHLLGEIRLPAVQAGSSIMPGKVNPVILEAVIGAGLRVKALDGLVADAVSSGTLQICEFLPVAAEALLESLRLLTRAAEAFAAHVAGIGADAAVCRANADRSPTLVTAFLPNLGYERAEALVAEYRRGGGTDFRAFLAERLGAEVVERTLDPHRLTALGYRDDE